MAPSFFNLHHYTGTANNGNNGSGYFALEKGTYYITFVVYSSDSIKVKFTSTPQENINKDNYNRARAITLKAKKWATVAQTPNYNYTRWYRINLTKRQVIHIYTNDGAANYINLFDSEFKTPSVARGQKQIITEGKMPKGTYYIRVSSLYEGYPSLSSAYIHFKWQ